MGAIILDDGRRWGRDNITITLTRRQWFATLQVLAPNGRQLPVFSEDYFTQDERNRIYEKIFNNIPAIQPKPKEGEV